MTEGVGRHCATDDNENLSFHWLGVLCMDEV